MMSRKVRLTVTVRREVYETADYIAETSSTQALRLLDEFEQVLIAFVSWPGELQRRVINEESSSGRWLRAAYLVGFRQHLIVYEVREEEVLVHSFVHASRVTADYLESLLEDNI